VLRVIVQASAQAAKSYYAGSGGEYYAEGQERAGEWGGRGATRLGLRGLVEPAEFDALCENRHPATGERLTARTKTIRRVGFDLNFHVPKSVSVVYGLSGDAAVLKAFREAVRETLSELEAETRTRVRTGGRDETRTTGNLVYSLFVHATARPVDGIPDPHLHAHAFVFNSTFDEAERRWKAIELGEVYKNAPYYEAAFHARLARKLADLEFDIARTETGWEISGIPGRVLKAFSRRTERIEAIAGELGVTDPDMKGDLGAKTRERKQLRFTLDELRTLWKARLTPDERRALERVSAREVAVAVRNPDAAREAMAFAVAHGFERSSVVPVKRLLAAALRHGIGQASLEDVRKELGRHGLIVRDYEGERVATTAEVLAEETRILSFARRGRNSCRPLVAGQPTVADWLSPQQQTAVRHVLNSTDRVILVRGVAGSGKTTLIRACVDAIEGEGRAVLLLAPSAEASRGVLRKEGFATADTVARFLLDQRLQESVRGGVLWIDEAGLLGLKTLDAVFRLADQLQARVVLSGDERQHHAVERGSPFTLLQRLGGLEPATVREIRRQTGRYREAVALLSEAKTVEGFDLLDRDLGWVRELPDGERAGAMAAEYVEARRAGETVLAVSPTHAEGAAITRAIRSTLRRSGLIANDELEFARLDARDLTLAERREPRFYRVDDVIEFHTQAKGFPTGKRFTVTAIGRSSIAAKDDGGRETIVPLRLADRYRVYTKKPLTLSVGDRVRITKNGQSKNRKRLDNGTISTVIGFKPDGKIELEGGAILAADFGHLAHGYVVTSYASQGKTVDRVLIAQSSESFPASNREQFYVSASRARHKATVYTDDKASLRRAIERSDPQLSATELVHGSRPPVRVWRAWVSRRLEWLKRQFAGSPAAVDVDSLREVARSPR